MSSSYLMTMFEEKSSHNISTFLIILKSKSTWNFEEKIKLAIKLLRLTN